MFAPMPPSEREVDFGKIYGFLSKDGRRVANTVPQDAIISK